jgi:hypothetical protein
LGIFEIFSIQISGASKKILDGARAPNVRPPHSKIPNGA